MLGISEGFQPSHSHLWGCLPFLRRLLLRNMPTICKANCSLNKPAQKLFRKVLQNADVRILKFSAVLICRDAFFSPPCGEKNHRLVLAACG